MDPIQYEVDNDIKHSQVRVVVLRVGLRARGETPRLNRRERRQGGGGPSGHQPCQPEGPIMPQFESPIKHCCQHPDNSRLQNKN